MNDSPLLVEDLIPQRPRMKMIDAILELDANHVVTSARIRDDWPGAAHGQANFTALIELAAQSVAALVGARDRQTGRTPGVGYLVGVKEAAIHAQTVALHLPLVTRVTLVAEVGIYGVFRAQVESNGAPLADLELQVYRPE